MPCPLSRRIRSDRGSALLIAVIMAVAVVLLMAAGSQLIVTSFRETRQQQHFGAEVDNIARAGLVDAISWFRRQQMQPVRSGYPPTRYAWSDGAFDPRVSTDAVKNDTIDESIGIVKEYQLSENSALWARYEVKRQTNTTVAAYDPYAVHDITGERLFTGEQNGQGYAWYLCSKGYIYRRKNASVPFDTSPNEVVARSKVSTEIRRLSLNTQVPCAFICNYGGTNSSRKVKVNPKGRIYGGTYGCGRSSGSAPQMVAGSTMTGTSSAYNPTSFMLSQHTPQYVLGVSTSDLKIMADYLVTDVSQLPETLPDMTLIYVNGNATFSSSRPLRSSGVLFVAGNLTISAGSNSTFSGLIYATGSATIEDPCFISGCVVAFNGLTLSRSSGATDVAEIRYDSAILDMVRQQICQYREMKSTYRIFTGFSDY